MSKKNPNRPNNVMKHELLRNPLYREKREKSAEERDEQRNPYSKKAKHKGQKLDEAQWVMGMEMTPENYVIEWVKHGRKNDVPLKPWEQAFQDAGMIEAAEHKGYIHISRNVACDISLTTEGQKLVRSYYEEALKPKSLSEFYQVGDKVEIIDGPLKGVLDRAEKLRKKKREEEGREPGSKEPDQKIIVREPMGPAGTLGITIDGEYHIVDEEDVKLIYEAFDYVDLTEWSYAETTSGLRVPVSGEENDILKMCSSPVYKSNLDDREQEVARRMVSRGVLHRHKDDDGIFFLSDNKKLTRF